MADLPAVHKALRDQLDTIRDLSAFAHPPQGGTPPVAFVTLDQWLPTTMGRHLGHRQYALNVFVFTAQTSDPRGGYQRLMEYASATGDRSVEAAIYAGHDGTTGTYGGLPNVQVHVTGFQVLGQREIDAFQMYGGLFTVEVHTRE